MREPKRVLGAFIAGGCFITAAIAALHVLAGFSRGPGVPEKLTWVANIGAASLATFMLFRAAAAEKGIGRAPWFLLAVSGCGFVIMEAVRFYWESFLGYQWRAFWVLLIFNYLFAIAALAVKFSKVAKSPASLFRSLVVAALLMICSAVVIYVYNIVFTMRALRPFEVGIVMLVPLADTSIVLLVAYIVATYGKGVLGRPWVAIAIAAALSALGDISFFFADYAYPRYRHILTDVFYTTAFAGYFSLAISGFYQRLLLTSRPVKTADIMASQHG